MIENTMLDTILSLIFIILLVSIMVTGINELIFTGLKTRNKKLKEAMDHLFFDTQWKEILKKIRTSPFMKVLQPSTKKLPNYIPASNFSQALIETSIEHLDEFSDDFRNIATPLEKLKKANQANLGETGDFIYQLALQSKTFEELQKKIEDYFNLAMDRVTGIYRRYAKTWSMIVAFGICMSFNIDVIQLTKHFINNDKASAEVAQKAIMASQNMELDSVQVEVNGQQLFMGYVTVEKKSSGNSKDSVELLKDSTSAKTDTSINTYQKFKAELRTLPIPLGWKDVPKTICKQAEEAGNRACVPSWVFIILLWIQKIFGITATAFAASMGAPFWFDLLQKISPLKKKKNTQ